VKLLNPEQTSQIKELFAATLKSPIKLLYFYDKSTCATCNETEQLLDEISSLSSNIQIKKYDIRSNQSIAQNYNVQLTPGLVVAGENEGKILDYGIRFAGIPSGYEFGSLIQAILLVSKRDSALKPAIRNELKKLNTPIHLMVFVTPTWPYCPQAVVLAHQLALESPMIQAEMVEAIEFFDLASRYNVSGVPQTIINDGAGVILGAVPEDYLLQEIRRVI
jgi:glutaredoxin-like protein